MLRVSRSLSRRGPAVKVPLSELPPSRFYEGDEQVHEGVRRHYRAAGVLPLVAAQGSRVEQVVVDQVALVVQELQELQILVVEEVVQDIQVHLELVVKGL